MKRQAWLSLLLLASGCGEDVLDLRIELPDAYRDAIARLETRILRPGLAEPFDCEDIAYGAVDEDAARFSLETQLSFAPGGNAPLPDLDRNSAKVVVVEGFDDAGQAVVSGCLEIDAVGEELSRTLVATPVPRLTDVRSSTLSVALGAKGPLRFGGQLVDFRNEGLADAEVRVRILSPAGVSAVETTRTDGDGRWVILAAAPIVPGPFVAELRARGGADDATRLSGFIIPPIETRTLPGDGVDHRAGRVGPNGKPGVVSLIRTETGKLRASLLYRDGAGGFTEVQSPELQGTIGALGLVLRPNRARDLPVVVTEAGWWSVEEDGTLTRSANYVLPLFDPNPVSVEAFQDCDSDPVIVVSYAQGLTRFHDEAGSRTLDFGANAFSVFAAGCLTNELGGETRLMVANEPGSGLVLIAEDPGNPFLVRGWVAWTQGMGFARAEDGTKLLVGTQLLVNDFVISRARIRFSGPDVFDITTYDFEQPPHLPVFNLFGDISGDGKQDTLALLDASEVPGDGTDFELWASLGGTVEGLTLRGAAPVEPESAPLKDPRLMLVDLDEDGVKDAVIAERSTTSRRVLIYALGQVSP